MRILSSTVKLVGPALLIAAAAMPSAAGAQPSKSYKDPNTGADCVQETTSEYSSSGKHIFMNFKNSCGSTFSIWYETRTGRKSATGIGPYGTSQLTIGADEDGGQWWFD